MASVKCKNCGIGIHHHGLPNGIEYIMIENESWEKIITNKFNPNNKVLNPQTGYPKMFRTDTIEDDYPSAIKKYWKCPGCGAIIFFDEKGFVRNVYRQSKGDKQREMKAATGYIFDDYLWEELTEDGFENYLLPEKVSAINEIFVSDTVVLIKYSASGIVTKYECI